MKKTLLSLFIPLLVFSACSKKTDVTVKADTSHTIKMTITANNSYTYTVSYIKKGTTNTIQLATMGVPDGALYSYAADLHTGDTYIFDVTSLVKSTITYTVVDNNTAVVSKTTDISPNNAVKEQFIIKD